MSIQIDRQLSTSNRLTKVKTAKARRSISFDELTGETFTEWRRRQETNRSAAGSRWSQGPAFVVTTRSGTPMDAANLRRAVSSACARADVDRIVPYELRHTAISFQVDSGHEAWQVADWAGTSVRMVEEVYRHRLHEVAHLRPVSVPGLAE